MYLSFGTSNSSLMLSFSNFSERTVDFVETLVNLSAILLPIKSPGSSAVFRIALFEAGFIVSVVDFVALSRSL